MIQLRKSSAVADRADVELLKTEFEKKQCVLLRGLIEPALLDSLARGLDRGLWCERVHRDIGVELTLQDLPALSLLHFCRERAFLDASEDYRVRGFHVVRRARLPNDSELRPL